MGGLHKAVFLDKDGTLVPDIPYNSVPDRIRLEDGAAAALTRLRQAGFKLVLVSNQSGVARGLFPIEALQGVTARIQALLAAAGVPALDGIFYCPHHPEGNVPEYATVCDCRKPEPGLFLQAARLLDIDLSRSWMVGDILNDVEAGHRAGCRSVLIDNGNETEWVRSPAREPDALVANLREAADAILRMATASEVKPVEEVAQHG
jgi:D,D-heptose 1,7-bisphosphate phosphatase